MVIRVLLADDQPLVRAGIAMLLVAQPDIEVVGEAGDGRRAVEQASRLRPDVVVMDVRMPGLDGIEATARITDADGHRPKVLILTSAPAETAIPALRSGASGYLPKQAAPAELTRAVRAVAAGDGWLDPGVTGRFLREFWTRPPPRRPHAELGSLTPREREVLHLVAHGLSNSQIAEHLVIGEGTVKTHYSRILTKLRLHTRAQAVVVAFRSGLVRPDERSHA